VSKFEYAATLRALQERSQGKRSCSSVPARLSLANNYKRSCGQPTHSVDFEQGLNNAMKRLRAALDDNAESPHFIGP